MNNICIFSEDRKYRYSLRHFWGKESDKENPIAWIALNPSTADENKLDPTLRRIKGFSESWGYNCFYMLNIFAYRATDPREMKKQEDPVGPLNDFYIKQICKKCDTIVCAWGNHGKHLNRSEEVLKNLFDTNPNICYLELSKIGEPKHPLYLKGDLNLKKYEFRKN